MLTPLQVKKNSLNICRTLNTMPDITYASSIAAYLSFGNEVNLNPFLSHSTQRKQHILVPTLPPISGKRQLSFRQWKPTFSNKPNIFGIDEPKHSKVIPTKFISVILVPLVGFTKEGYRVGMGGGYYDYTFKHLSNNIHHRTLLIGIAHDCQKIPLCKPQPWDIKLDRIVTEKQVYYVDK